MVSEIVVKRPPRSLVEEPSRPLSPRAARVDHCKALAYTGVWCMLTAR
jgi:hypothetical protein